MKDRADIDRVLDHWFSDGPSRMPDRVVDIVADRIAHQRQRPSWRRLTWRANHMNGSLRIAAAVAAVLVIGLVGFRLLGTAAAHPSARRGSSTDPHRHRQHQAPRPRPGVRRQSGWPGPVIS